MTQYASMFEDVVTSVTWLMLIIWAIARLIEERSLKK